MQIKLYAQKCADRIPVGGEAAGGMRFDPVTILTIFTTILPLLMTCLKQEEPTPAEMRTYIREGASTPKKRKRLNTRIAGRIRGAADEPMSREEARQLADSVIDESLNGDTTDDDVMQLVAACETAYAASLED